MYRYSELYDITVTQKHKYKSKRWGPDIIIIINQPMTIWDFMFPVQIETDDSKRSKKRELQ